MATLTDIAAVLRRAQSVLAISHVSPDGDAVSSLLGLGWLLRAVSSAQGPNHPPCPTPSQRASRTEGGGGAGCQVFLACADSIPVQLRFLPGAAAIASNPPDQPWDAVVTLDASDPQRLGAPFRPDSYGRAVIINIDHHVTNLCFGDLNYVDTEAAATAQIMVDLADALQVPIEREAAVCLLTGLVTDTLSFRTSNVTSRVMATAMRLMEAGASLAEITERALNHKPLSMMRLWGLALAELRLQGQTVWTHITQRMRTQVNAADSGDGGLVNHLIQAPEARIAAVFSEMSDGRVEVSFRARPGYDVSELALGLGGGGHPQAAGCILPGPLAAAEARVLPLLTDVLGRSSHESTVSRHPQPEQTGRLDLP
jgi:phosphoesterase RecJ-like protein